MASPQVANDDRGTFYKLYDRIISLIAGGRRAKVAHYILRNTHGMYGAKSVIIDYQTMADATGLDRNHCAAALLELVEMRVINLVPKREQELRIVSVNGAIHEWKSVPKRELVPKRDQISPKTGPAPISRLLNNYPPIGSPPKIPKQKTQTPAEFLITPERMQWVRDTFGDVPKDLLSVQRDSFLDRNRSLGNTYVNWNAAWQNWLRKWWFEFKGKEQALVARGGTVSSKSADQDRRRKEAMENEWGKTNG